MKKAPHMKEFFLVGQEVAGKLQHLGMEYTPGCMVHQKWLDYILKSNLISSYEYQEDKCLIEFKPDAMEYVSKEFTDILHLGAEGWGKELRLQISYTPITDSLKISYWDMYWKETYNYVSTQYLYGENLDKYEAVIMQALEYRRESKKI